jgi:beta-glucanase (GH16 family)
MPTGAGTWPAIWTLGKNISEVGAYWFTQGFGSVSWPACGEIDIMEHWGNNQNFVQSAMHTPSSFGATENHGGRFIPTVSDSFHVYILDWYPNKMVFSVDGIEHYTYQPNVQNAATWPFTQDQYLLLNIAIEPSIAANFTSSAMEVDYVRIFQQNTLDLPEIGQPVTWNAFPNPAQTHLTIQTDESGLGATLEVVDLQGRVIEKIPMKYAQQTIDIDTWHAGIYFIRMIGDLNASALKIVKE